MKSALLWSMLMLSAAPAVSWAKGSKAGTVTCEDGSKSKSGRGACSHHGGVSARRSEESRPEARPEPRPERRSSGRTAAPERYTAPGGNDGSPTARCNDGSVSYSAHHTGACSHHGGVQRWLSE